jgi:hypothetical protein
MRKGDRNVNYHSDRTQRDILTFEGDFEIIVISIEGVVRTRKLMKP